MKRSIIGSGGGKGSLEIWCSHVATEEARALAQILEDAGMEALDFGDEPKYEVRSRDPSDGTDVSVLFSPLLPHVA